MFRHNPDKSVRRGGLLTALGALIALALTPISFTQIDGARAAASGHDDSRRHDPGPNSGVVRDWNLHAVDALSNASTAPVPGAGQPPPVSALHLAMVQGAVYDAVNSIDGGHQPYLAGLPAASPAASKEAAVATAAHHVLVGLGIAPVPALAQAILDRLDALYADALAGIADDVAKTDGIAAGAAAAAAMLAARTGDGRYVADQFTVGTEPGQWRPTPPAMVNDPFAWVANVEPFVLQSPSQFQSKGPLDVRSRAYAKEYDEVKDLGELNSPRNDKQDAIARFYIVNPVELFNRTFRAFAEERGLSLVEEARLFAMLNIAGADSLINCWSDKEEFGFWRPITAIHEGDNDGNRRTAGDTEWTPFLPPTGTPPYPDHPSGYNCVTGAMMYTAEAFFGKKKVHFSVVNVPNEPNVTRVYKRFTDVIEDTIDARVYQGLHFRTADEQGAKIGKKVAHWLDRHYFQRVK